MSYKNRNIAGWLLIGISWGFIFMGNNMIGGALSFIACGLFAYNVYITLEE